MIKIDKTQKQLLVINVVFCAVLFLLLIMRLSSINIFSGVVFVYYIFVMIQFIRKCLTEKVDVVDLTAVFFMMYIIFATIVFSIPSFLEKIELFMFTSIPKSDYNIKKYLFVLFVSFAMLTHVIVDGIGIGLFSNRVRVQYKFKKFRIPRITLDFHSHGLDLKKSIVVASIILLASICLYIYKLTGGVYIAYSGVSNANSLFNILSWIAILTSGIIPVIFKPDDKRKSKIIYFLLFLLIVLYWMLKIRMYCAMFFIELVMCAYIEGFRLKRKHLIVVAAGMVLLLFGNVLRFSSYNFGDMYYDIYTVFGEFIASSVSGYYLVNNPLGFGGGLRFLDLVLQLLPSAIRPTSSLHEFASYYTGNGHNPWPVGGILFQGQLYFYFGPLFFLVFFLVVAFLFKVRRTLLNGENSVILAMFPVFCMIMPRLEIWTLRSCVISACAYLILMRRTRRYNNS